MAVFCARSARMVFAAQLPLCRATEPSCGWVLPSLSGMFAMSPMTRTPGNPSTVKSGATSIRPPRPCGSPAVPGDRRGHQPAAPDDATGLDRGPVRQRHVTRVDGLHADPQHQLDAVLLEDPGRVGVTLVGEHRQQLFAVVDEVDLRTRCQRREFVDHRRVDHLGQGAGDLDPGRTAADDDEVDGAFVDEVRIAVRFLECLDDPRPQAVGIIERVEREGVLGARASRRSSAASRRPGRCSRPRRSRRCASSRSGRPGRSRRPQPASRRSRRIRRRSCAADRLIVRAASIDVATW